MISLNEEKCIVWVIDRSTQVSLSLRMTVSELGSLVEVVVSQGSRQMIVSELVSLVEVVVSQ